MEKARLAMVSESCLQISHKFFKKVTKPLGIDLGEEREYGVGTFFFPQDDPEPEIRP